MNENNNKDSLTQERINLRNRMVGYINNNEHIDSKTIMIETNEDIFNNAMNKNIYNDLEVILQKSNEKI